MIQDCDNEDIRLGRRRLLERVRERGVTND